MKKSDGWVTPLCTSAGKDRHKNINEFIQKQTKPYIGTAHAVCKVFFYIWLGQ